MTLSITDRRAVPTPEALFDDFQGSPRSTWPELIRRCRAGRPPVRWKLIAEATGLTREWCSKLGKRAQNSHSGGSRAA